MVCNRDWVAAVLVMLSVLSASAQTAKPDAAAEAAAAMERAKRQASGPMRVILEASKARRKGNEPEAPPAAETASVRPVAVRSAAAAAAAPAAAPAGVATALGSATLVSQAPAGAPAMAEPAAVAAPVAAAVVKSAPVLTTLSSEALQTKSVLAPVPGLELTRAAAEPAPPLASSAAIPSLAAGPARVKLVNRVDPEVPQRLLDELGRNALVLVDLGIRADGSVSAVTLAGPAPRSLLRWLVAALEQWQFEPLPAARVHRIELLFNGEQ